jgi:hypothetical protein
MNKKMNIFACLVIPTQFGNVPDVAFEEIKEIRAQQQQQQPGSIPIPTSSFASTISNPNNTTSDPNSIQTRSTARDSSVNNSNNLARSRSLASNTNVRPSIAAASTYVSNPAYQTPLFATNKQQSFLSPPRFGVNRFLTGGPTNNNPLPPAPSTSSTSYASNRSLPISTSPNIKYRHGNHHNHHHNQPAVTINSAATATNNEQTRPHYETTYRASFIKPLAP